MSVVIGRVGGRASFGIGDGGVEGAVHWLLVQQVLRCDCDIVDDWQTGEANIVGEDRQGLS